VPPTASVLIPTRRRRDYLAAALASVAPQVAAHGAEVVVVEDDPADPATEALVRAHGGRYAALGRRRGLNLARNAAMDAAGGELLCFLDDDIAAWPGWLAALLAAADANPGHEAFGGPIRPVLEGTNLHACGREPLPVTGLDLGPEDTDAELVWGANLAVRRAAVERIGPFDPVRSGPGDEEEWERRLRAAGGRIRYVAAAGVDHRRTGADARISGLSRAAWHRGRHGRRYDEEKGLAPPLRAELRTLAGCVWHIGRRRCGNGIVLAAQTAGRIREALAPADGGGSIAETVPADRADAAGRGGGAAGDVVDRPYLAGQSGTLGRRGLLSGHARDLAADALTAPRRRALRQAARDSPPRRRVHVLGIARPEHRAVTDAIAAELARSRHDVALHLTAGAPGLGKWENLRAAPQPPAGADWLLLVDDDVVLPHRFLDVFLHVSEAHDLKLAQPAHAFASHAAWPVTRRRPGLVARRSRFVEIGPVTAIHADAFPALLPFPPLAMGWGLDAHWSAAAAHAGLRLGIVDATPVRHLRPVAASYPHAAAVAEADAFLAGREHVTREEAAQVLEAWS
jgi:GT2 family glycosyltransferase